MQQGWPCLRRRSFLPIAPRAAHEGQRFGCGNNATGNDVAAHDAAEDIDEDALHVRVLKDDGEAVLTCSSLAPPPRQGSWLARPRTT